MILRGSVNRDLSIFRTIVRSVDNSNYWLYTPALDYNLKALNLMPDNMRTN